MFPIKHFSLRLLMMLGVAAFALAACGGGHKSSSTSTSSTSPSSSSSSSAASSSSASSSAQTGAGISGRAPRCSRSSSAMQCVLARVPAQSPSEQIKPRAARVYAYGVDFAWTRYDGATVFGWGGRFGASYLSTDGSKNWTISLLSSYHARGMTTVAVWETTATRALSGYAGGAGDARSALSEARALNFPGNAPIYFAVDFDETPGQASIVASYFRGVDSVLGAGRAGGYGGYWTVKRLLDAGLIRYGWQTYAWSGGSWDSRAQLQQYRNGATYDWDRAVAANFGQFPVPAPPSPGPSPGPSPKPKPKPKPAPGWPLVPKGARGEQVRTVQQLLGVVPADGIEGPQTERAINQFKSRYGLKPDAVVWFDVWPRLVTVVREGSSGLAVRAVQRRMDELGNGLAIDGQFGPATRRVVTVFQRHRALQTDGIVGEQTWRWVAR